jgi:hypothetical protein
MQANKEIYLPADLLIEKFSTSRIIIQISTNDQHDSGYCDLIESFSEILIRTYVTCRLNEKNLECLWSKK